MLIPLKPNYVLDLVPLDLSGFTFSAPLGRVVADEVSETRNLVNGTPTASESEVLDDPTNELPVAVRNE